MPRFQQWWERFEQMREVAAGSIMAVFGPLRLRRANKASGAATANQIQRHPDYSCHIGRVLTLLPEVMNTAVDRAVARLSCMRSNRQSRMAILRRHSQSLLDCRSPRKHDRIQFHRFKYAGVLQTPLMSTLEFEQRSF